MCNFKRGATALLTIKPAIIAILIFGFLAAPASGEQINWKSYAAGIQQARTQHKKIFLHFTADWCGYCRKMDALTFKDAAVIDYLNKNFISIKVNGDKEKQVTQNHKVSGFPDNRFYDAKLNQAFRVPGFVDPMAFKFYMEYVSTDSYKDMSPQEYYRTKTGK